MTITEGQVKVSVDVGYAYDLMSINRIKAAKGNEQAGRSAGVLAQEIIDQIGGELHHDIMCSNEYMDLYEANLKVFLRIDEMKVNPLADDAQYVDLNNYARYLAKKALQEKFFPAAPLKEQKMGYT